MTLSVAGASSGSTILCCDGFPSKVANWLMAKLSGVELHDFGTTFQGLCREVVQKSHSTENCTDLFRRWHRAYGATICEIPIRNVNRERGESHYGISRTCAFFFDLITIASC